MRPEMLHIDANAPDIPASLLPPGYVQIAASRKPVLIRRASGDRTSCRGEGIHMAIHPSEEKRIHVELTVLESQREELQLAWHEIVAGRRPRMDALNHEISSITARAMEALRTIEGAIRRNPTTGQARRLVWFLAAVYNGPEFLFDLTELRALDCELANACLDYLNYDRLGRREVHSHLSSGDVELQQWIDDYDLRPRGRPTD
jgi:hypothetical protein